MANIKISSLASEVVKSLKEYSESLSEEVNKAADIVSKELVSDIKNDSPTLTGNYKRGWHRKRVNGKYVVYNKTDWQLTHLLEHGHSQKHNGKRYKPVKGFEHILKNRDAAEEKFIKLCKDAASGKQVIG